MPVGQVEVERLFLVIVTLVEPPLLVDASRMGKGYSYGVFATTPADIVLTGWDTFSLQTRRQCAYQLGTIRPPE